MPYLYVFHAVAFRFSLPHSFFHSVLSISFASPPPPPPPPTSLPTLNQNYEREKKNNTYLVGPKWQIPFSTPYKHIEIMKGGSTWCHLLSNCLTSIRLYMLCYISGTLRIINVRLAHCKFKCRLCINIDLA